METIGARRWAWWRLATREYADELVVLCVALELGIRITIIPYTPPDAIGQWAVATYGREDAEHVLHLGNNDAHYVYLSQATLSQQIHRPRRQALPAKLWSRRACSESVCSSERAGSGDR